MDDWPRLPVWKARSKAEADTLLGWLNPLHEPVRAFQDAVPPGSGIAGYSITAGKPVEFIVRWPESGSVNWRETVRCPETNLTARVRAAYHIYLTERGEAAAGDRLYLTEQTTAFYRWIKAHHPQAVGSEFLPDVPFGTENAKGVRSEDLTKLSFETASFDGMLSLDVLEHVPDYRAALAECARVLKPGGVAIISAPFAGKAETIVRASIGADGEIVHHLPPDYHGDPIRKEGILCFYWFGFSLLDEMRAAGFADAAIGYYCSREFGYLDPMRRVVIGRR